MSKQFRIFGFLLLLAAVAFGCQRKDGSNAKSDTKATKTAAAAGGDSTILPVGKSYATGSDKALITIIEFSEFQCPFCKRVGPTMDQIKKTYGDKVRIVFKHNPLPFHKDAPLAAQASLAAGKQGKFWEMHDVLFENMKKLKPADITGYAKTIGLNMDTFNTDLNSADVKAQVAADMALAKKVGARGTPHFFVNGERVSGAQPFANFKKVIDKQLEAANAAIKAGTKADAVYAAMVKKSYKEAAPRKPRGGQADDSKVVYKVEAGNSYFKGGKEPLVTIIEFSEFQCPFCSRVNPTIKKILDTYGDLVKVVFKHNPLPFHKDAPLAAQATLAAGAQGKFWQMHDVLFQNMKKLKADDLNGYAEKIGLDMAKFKADLSSGKYKKEVAADQALAKTFQARGTPHFFVNGRRLRGAQPFPSFKKLIDEEKNKAEKLVASGTARKDVYAKTIAKGKTKAAPPAPRKNKAKADDKTVYKVPVAAADGSKGGKEPLVTIVEFSEFQCPFCSRVNPTVAQIQKKYGNDVRIVFKHNPLPFHKDAPLAAEAALAAKAQGKFWQMHDVLFQNMKKLKPADIDGYAKQVGLDMTQFKADLTTGKFKKQIAADQALARQLGAGGTPNFFINGRKLVGAQPIGSFTKVIDEEIKKAKALIAKGTKRSNIYNELTKNGATKAAAPTRKPPQEDTKVYTVKVNAGDAVKGGKNAKVTIVEFSEFQCPFCSRVNPTIKKIMDTYGDKVRVVFKHNPLSFHKDAPLASEAALAAGAQGKFWDMHDILFKNQRKLKAEDIDGYAKELGLNMKKFKDALTAGTYKKQIAADQAQARELNARGTPHFFINGRRLRGAQPYPRFKKLIDEQLKK